jgi:hypothetical protein
MCWEAQRPMARWAEDGSVAKPRGGKGGTFVRCLTSKQIEVRASEYSPPHPSAADMRSPRQTSP